MIETQGKLLFTAFFTIMIGVALIQPIGDGIELAGVSSRTVTNESVTLTVTTASVLNETNTLVANTTTLAGNHLTILSGLRNISSNDILGFCNITVSTGVLVCNETYNVTVYADYTFNDFSTGTLANDELSSFDACRNSSMETLISDTHCNVTLPNGAVKVIYDNVTDDLVFIDYQYEPDTYVHSSTARVLLSNTRLFFAIAILILGVGFAIAGFKHSGAI